LRRIALIAKEGGMSEPARLITLQFLAWIEDRPRTYPEVMEAWRSTCPQLSVWEDAIIAGLVRIESGARRAVTLTERGRNVLAHSRAATDVSTIFEPPRRIAAE
jgi:hypothetical protein